MTKKIFAISTLVLILLIGAIFVYNFAFKKTVDPAPSTKASDEGKTGNVQTDANKKPENPTTKKTESQLISAISDGPVFGAVLAPDGNSIYCFSALNGQLNQVDFDGKLEKVISTEEFRDILQADWNKQRNKVIMKRAGDKNQPKFLYSDLSQKTVIPLKDNIDSISWSSLGDKIIYKHFDPTTQKRTLNVADPNGSNWQKIADVSYFEMNISSIPGSTDISFWPTPDALSPSVVSIVSWSGDNKKEILKDRFGVDLLWSPDGKLAAVSASDQKGGGKTDLAVMNSDGGQFQSFEFPTFSKKCAWSVDSKYLFCAMPGNIPEASILPNDWQNGNILTTDTFWKIEVATGEKTRLIETENINDSFDVLNPFLSQDEKSLFFTNKADGKLYRLAF